MTQNPRTNRLIQEKSPYLLQHAHNPVDWFGWGPEAFEKATKEHKPIFLSIGYSTCHWCHVMERESFEDTEVAAILNESFVSIKVDREERPDIDHIYMTVCQALTGQGGWPLTIIMTPDQHPFFAGTYFPKRSRYGRPGLMDVLTQVTKQWSGKSGDLSTYGRDLMGHVAAHMGADQRGGSCDPRWIDDAYGALSKSFDASFGGFGDAPKFPTPHTLMFLLRVAKKMPQSEALTMVTTTLDAIANGGIHDHVGGGFARYSTDEQWLVPHFEKMLYDNALLAMAYTEAFQMTGTSRYRDIVLEIFEYLERDMRNPDGGYYSAEDADSEGEEGKFYVWSPEEVIEALGDADGKAYCTAFDIGSKGNFEGKSIPNRIGTNTEHMDPRWVQWNRALRGAREKRIRPHLDDKILTSWNALLIVAYAKASRAFALPHLADSAARVFTFLQSQLTDDTGRILARYRDGEAKYPGYVDDYAFLIWGAIELYEATFHPQYLQFAIQWQHEMIRLFWDEEHDGFYYSGSDAETLVARPKELYDGAMPSGNSVAALNLVRLARLTGDPVWERRAQAQLEAFVEQVGSYPSGFTFYLMALQYATGQSRELVMVGALGELQSAIQQVGQRFAPNEVTVVVEPGQEGEPIHSLCPAVAAFTMLDQRPTFYTCENYACERPTTDVETWLEALG